MIGRKAILVLFVFNCILVGVSWISAVVAYPRLPQVIPYWMTFSGRPALFGQKSILFFIYPLVQALLLVAFRFLSQCASRKLRLPDKALVFREVLYLALIFINLIFIHVQRSLIFAAHQVSGGFSRFYFYSLFAILGVLYFYYRIRLKVADRQEGKEL